MSGKIMQSNMTCCRPSPRPFGSDSFREPLFQEVQRGPGRRGGAFAGASARLRPLLVAMEPLGLPVPAGPAANLGERRQRRALLQPSLHLPAVLDRPAGPLHGGQGERRRRRTCPNDGRWCRGWGAGEESGVILRSDL